MKYPMSGTPDFNRRPQPAAEDGEAAGGAAPDSKGMRRLLVCLALLFVVCLLPFALSCRYVHPVNDDYFYALTHVGCPPLVSVLESWLHWSGRYLATFLSAFNPLLLGEGQLTTYRLLSLGVVCLFGLVPLCSSWMLTHRVLGTGRSLGLGAFFCVVYLSLCPKVSELFYWFSAYTSYTLPGLLVLLFFGLLPRKGRVAVCLQGLLAMLIPGGNEVTAVLFLCTLLYLSAVRREPRIVMLTALAALGTLVVVASPGNAIRMSGQLSAHPYLWAAVASPAQSVSWLFLWGPALLLATWVYVPLFGVRLARWSAFDVSFRRYVAFVSVTLVLAHVPPTLGLSSVMTARTANSLWLFFILFYFGGVQILLRHHADRIAPWAAWLTPRWAAVGLFAFTFLCPLALESPVTTACMDALSGKSRRYDESLTRRDLQAGAAGAGADTLLFEPLGLTARTLFVKDLEAEPDGLFCTAYRDYHQLKRPVRLKREDVRFLTNYETLFVLGKLLRGDYDDADS